MGLAAFLWGAAAEFYERRRHNKEEKGRLGLAASLCSGSFAAQRHNKGGKGSHRFGGIPLLRIVVRILLPKINNSYCWSKRGRPEYFHKNPLIFQKSISFRQNVKSNFSRAPSPFMSPHFSAYALQLLNVNLKENITNPTSGALKKLSRPLMPSVRPFIKNLLVGNVSDSTFITGTKKRKISGNSYNYKLLCKNMN